MLAGIKYQRIQVFIIYPAVDHVHLLQAGGGFHIYFMVLYHQVAAFNQFNAH